jgi:hypothetical protein
MTPSRWLLLLFAATALAGGEAIATWEDGPGSIGATPAGAGAAVPAGAVLAIGDRPVRLALVGAPGSAVELAPASAATFLVEDGRIVIALASGRVQVDLPDRGPWAGLIVRGAALEAQVTGTLFLVERTRKDADYVALVRGALKVGLRREIALALGRAASDAIELRSRQGAAGSTAGGLGSAEALSSRPQLLSAASLRDQALVPDPAASSWSGDPAQAGPMPDPVALMVQQTINDVAQQVAAEVANAVAEDVRQQVVQQVVETVVGTTPGALAGPPGPPP